MSYTKGKCKYFTEFKNTPNMPYDCERVYQETENIKDMIHFKSLDICKQCKYFQAKAEGKEVE